MPFYTLLQVVGVYCKMNILTGGIVMTRKFFRKIFVVWGVFLLLFVSSLVGSAESSGGQCGDNVTWNLENGILTISGTGDMYNWSSDNPSPFAQLEGIEYVEIQDGITSVGNRTFRNCKNIKEVNISSSVESIGDYAFNNCTSLEYVDFGTGLKSIGEYAFGHAGIRSLAMPDSVELVGEYAFEVCSSLEKVYVSKNLKTIPEGCFFGCQNLLYVTIPEGVEQIEGDAFWNHGIWELYIPKSLTYIGASAFDSNFEMDVVYYGGTREQFDMIDDDGSYIGNTYETMYTCNLDNPYGYDILSDGTVKLIDCFAVRPVLEVPETIDGYVVSEIGDDLYDGKLVTSVTIPPSIKRIGAEAFEYTNMREVTVPSTVEYIGDGAFSGISVLKNIVVDSQNANYCTVDGNLYTKDMTRIVSYCNGKTDKKFEIPKEVTIISGNCFASSKNLCEIIIPNGVETIGESAFANTKNLKSIDIPVSVNSIGEEAFLYCANLESINVDDNNPYYFDDDGVLMGILEKEYAYLIQYPAAKKDSAYRIPDGTVEIVEMSFFNNSYLKTLLVPESLMYVERDVLYRTYLDKIYYEGTQQQFREIYDYRQLRNADVEYEYDINTVMKFADVMFYQQGNNVSCNINIEYSLQDMVIFMAFFDDFDALAHVEFVQVPKNTLNISKDFETDKNLAGNKCVVYAFSGISNLKPVSKPILSKVGVMEYADVVLETAHPLDSSETLTYTYPGECQELVVAFSSDTEVHESREYIVIYDGNNNLIGEYYGKELAGKVITIPGNHVEIYIRSRYQELYGVKTDYIQIIK